MEENDNDEVLRDHFALAAASGVIQKRGLDFPDKKVLARQIWEVADALIATRDERK